MRKAARGLWIAVALVLYPIIGMAGDWKSISPTSVITPSESDKGVFAGVIFIGPNVTDFIPYIAVMDSDVCGGKSKDSFSRAEGPGSLSIDRGPRVAAQTTCIDHMSAIAPETNQGIDLVGGYFMGGRFSVFSSVDQKLVRFNTDGVTKYLTDSMMGRQNRGL